MNSKKIKSRIKLNKARTKVIGLTIDRSEWLPVEVSSVLGIEGCLLHPDSGRMCCLGVVCRAAGIGESSLKGLAMPVGVEGRVGRKLPGFLRDLLIAYEETSGGFDDSEFAKTAADMNDRSWWGLKMREEELIKHFREAGITLKFVGDLNLPKSGEAEEETCQSE